jgi:Uma2 family endonuclease
VKVTLRLPHRATYADYLAAEQDSERRYEFFDGVIAAMAGGSDEHNAIAGRFAGLFGERVARAWLGYSSQQRFWIAASTRGRYSDGSIICGNPRASCTRRSGNHEPCSPPRGAFPQQRGR